MSHEAITTASRQETLIASLMKECDYPHSVSSIELFETHISWVILTGPFAYKIKKAIQLDFLDFSTLRLRRHYCEEELRLNRRWAPELYLEVVPILGSVEHPSIGGDGAAIEYALKMVQFPQSAQLDNQLTAGLLKHEDMRQLAEAIAERHEEAKVQPYTDDEECFDEVKAPMLDNFPPLEQVTDLHMLPRLQDWTEKALRELEPMLIERRKAGFVRECHGDLHLSNLVRLSGGIVAFDCVEFSAALRNIDVISDIAFLVMDLVARARQDLAYSFLNRYLECTGDYRGMALLSLYFVYHCMIRAKVAAIRRAERDAAENGRHDLEKLQHNLAVATRWIDAPEPRLVAMHGYSGSGKTWLSTMLMSELPAVRVRSDIERKRPLALDEFDSSESKPGSGIYNNRSRTGVYEQLIETAEFLLDAGYSVIVDASFLGLRDRQSISALAREQGVGFSFVHTSADRRELISRLGMRATTGQDASEADSEVLNYQYENADPLNAAERAQTVFVATDEVVDPGRITKVLNRIQG